MALDATGPGAGGEGRGADVIAAGLRPFAAVDRPCRRQSQAVCAYQSFGWPTDGAARGGVPWSQGCRVGRPSGLSYQVEDDVAGGIVGRTDGQRGDQLAAAGLGHDPPRSGARLAGQDAGDYPQGRPHPARSCASPTAAGTGSQPSLPTLGTGSSRTWNCATAAAHDAGTHPQCQRRRAAQLPLHGFNQNHLWCELVAMASELLAWTQMLAPDGAAHAWEPKRPRLWLISAAGCLVRGGRRLRLRLAATWSWASPDHCRDHPPAGLRPWLTSRNRPHHQEGQVPGTRGTPPTRRDSREARHSHRLNQPPPAAASLRQTKIAKHRG